MPKVTESSLKSALMRALRARLPGFVLLRHEDVRTSGIPDLSATGLGRTTWWEGKHVVDGHLHTHGAQELTMLRLDAAGFARYVLWEEKGDGVRRTLVVRPKHLGKIDVEAWTTGFDHAWLAYRIVDAHRRSI